MPVPDKLERLLNLLAALLDTRRALTVEEIGDRIPGYPENPASFRRAFERDKDDLRELGVPIRVETLDAAGTVGYRVDPAEYSLPDPGLTQEELTALRVATSLVQLEGGGTSEGLLKLGGAGPTAGTPLAQVPTSPELLALYEAVRHRNVASFDYQGARRQLQPHRLEFARGRWYASGFDLVREDRRSFRVDRIEGQVTLSEPDAFAPPDEPHGVRLASWELGDDTPATAELLVDASQAPFVLEHLGPEALIQRLGDGSVRVAVPVTNREALRSYVLSFLDHVELVGPPDMRADLVEWLEPLR